MQPSRFLRQTIHHITMTSKPPQKPAKEKRPPLTHFLCLPLVNATSLPQLETSLSTFKTSIPAQDDHGPLVPAGALRPVGTLHLTLGVMSLPTRERLEDAISFFHSLDLLAMVREAGRRARFSTTDDKNSEDKSEEEKDKEKNKEGGTPPFTISLESLHALPRARAATVLHAAPVDPTARLYPFCEMLREKFLHAGFLQGEVRHKAAGEEGPVPRPKARPLLLHATVANTIYVRGRKDGGSRKGRNDRIAFDARDLVAWYRGFYADRERTVPKSLQSASLGDGGSRGYPFVWAREFPVESVCICEMGAKKLDSVGDASGLNARLGEKYAAVAERRLDFGY
ncbi:AKAP7 2'5' RNA ligase-like domain-containing protein [Aspergillus avenaceus]|uniref:AKAP7 2'5' RNA ligase-like domain-containing protein n=1 Tax=Aspergillus avenaceus TaxID=36643 RepID=A0A5N6TM51_ASPAV|nr:AKAP7 2'5' RNA ligase-like domain-containing protein [Aspergillus avenaceus]